MGKEGRKESMTIERNGGRKEEGKYDDRKKGKKESRTIGRNEGRKE